MLSRYGTRRGRALLLFVCAVSAAITWSYEEEDTRHMRRRIHVI